MMSVIIAVILVGELRIRKLNMGEAL